MTCVVAPRIACTVASPWYRTSGVDRIHMNSPWLADESSLLLDLGLRAPLFPIDEKSSRTLVREPLGGCSDFKGFGILQLTDYPTTILFSFHALLKKIKNILSHTLSPYLPGTPDLNYLGGRAVNWSKHPTCAAHLACNPAPYHHCCCKAGWFHPSWPQLSTTARGACGTQPIAELSVSAGRGCVAHQYHARTRLEWASSIEAEPGEKNPCTVGQRKLLSGYV